MVQSVEALEAPARQKLLKVQSNVLEQRRSCQKIDRLPICMLQSLHSMLSVNALVEVALALTTGDQNLIFS